MPSPSTVPSQSRSNGFESPLGDSAGVFEKHMYMKISLKVSTPPVITMSDRPADNSSAAK